MLSGIICGLLTAFLQPVAYLFARFFFVRGGKALQLAIYSQVIMGLLAAIMLLCCWPFFSFTGDIAMHGIGCAVAILCAQVCYFMAIRVVEASRLTSMLGIKIIFLVFLNMLLFGEQLQLVHWMAVILCGAAGLVMNHSGLKISFKALFAIIACCFFLAVSDIADYRLVTAISHDNQVFKGVLATAFCYGILGVISLPGLLFTRFDWGKCKLAIPYSCIWIMAMIMFYLSVSLLGTVFTSIIQSSRGLISVLLGALLAWLGHASIESKAGTAVWISRLAAALLIMAAAAIFTCNPL